MIRPRKPPRRIPPQSRHQSIWQSGRNGGTTLNMGAWCSSKWLQVLLLNTNLRCVSQEGKSIPLGSFWTTSPPWTFSPINVSWRISVNLTGHWQFFRQEDKQIQTSKGTSRDMEQYGSTPEALLTYCDCQRWQKNNGCPTTETAKTSSSSTFPEERSGPSHNARGVYSTLT